MKEYWNKPEATAEAITPAGWFKSGDVARIDAAGNVYIMDRMKVEAVRASGWRKRAYAIPCTAWR